MRSLFLFSLVISSLCLDCSAFKNDEIKLVTFDAYAALFNTIPSLQQNIADALSHKINRDTAILFSECWVDYYAEYMYIDPKHYVEPFEDYMREGVPKCLQDLKISIQINEREIESLLNSWTRLQPWKNTVEVLYILSQKGYKLGILSNGSVKSLTALSKNSLGGVQIDYFFGSTKPKCFKPKPGIYAQSLDSGFRVDQIVHVAGGGVDVKGARSYGLFTFFNQVTDKSKEPFPTELEPCQRLNDITDILKYL